MGRSRSIGRHATHTHAPPRGARPRDDAPLGDLGVPPDRPLVRAHRLGDERPVPVVVPRRRRVAVGHGQQRGLADARARDHAQLGVVHGAVDARELQPRGEIPLGQRQVARPEARGARGAVGGGRARGKRARGGGRRARVAARAPRKQQPAHEERHGDSSRRDRSRALSRGAPFRSSGAPLRPVAPPACHTCVSARPLPVACTGLACTYLVGRRSRAPRRAFQTQQTYPPLEI